MAFLKQNVIGGVNNRGDFYEDGEWVASGGDTTGTLTPEASFANGPGLTKIEQADIFPATGFTVTYTRAISQLGLNLTFTANARGTYHLEGPAA